jgi:16S rRNA (guanine(966)-N(2))-methyltransferase RsmD
MRIVSGHLGGRKLRPPENLPVRPTTDLAKESLFNILNNLVDFEELSVLDLFTGTGSIGFEFVSRGAVEVFAVDTNNKCISFIDKTAIEFKVDNIHAIQSDVFMFLKHANRKFDIIFADPPYDMTNIAAVADLVFEKQLLNPDGLLIMEHPREVDFTRHPHFSQKRTYGKVNFSFLKAGE